LARLIVYLVGVGAMGTIAQGVVGRSLHDVVWTTHERPIKAQTHVVTETTPVQTVTITGETVTRPGAPGKTLTAPVTTALVTVPSPTTTTTTTTTVPGPAVTTTVSAKAETVPVLGPTVTTTVPGRTVTTTVPGPSVTTTVPGPTVTTTTSGPTETVTVTIAAECDPPPKKPSNPPCPPHK
jgi:hypothetical protein